MITDFFHKLAAAHQNGTCAGIVSICSANPFVIRAALEHARQDTRPVLIESTGRQVNQFRGYAGFTPAEFARYIRQAAKTAGLDESRIILGADHLGPGPWQTETADAAMENACELARQCVLAGFQKLHLDPSMPCKDDVKNGRPYISLESIAERSAILCKTAEKAAADISGGKSPLIYVVGAEVPLPGGIGAGDHKACVSTAEDLEKTITAMALAFARSGLADAWGRCVAIVAETGATFDAETVYPYDSRRTRSLQQWIENRNQLVFEAHSTDFQTRDALTDMVRDHLAILKTGPCLTYAVREALFSLAAIEKAFLSRQKAVTLSRLPAVMTQLMSSDPSLWQHHYRGSHEYLQYITVFGYSDRIRYYWSHPDARKAVDQLFGNLSQYGIPLPLVSQYLPDLLDKVQDGRIPAIPERLVIEKIKNVLDTYTAACGEKI